MPGWGDIVNEFGQSAAARGGMADADAIRRKYLHQLVERTGRSTILYYTSWLTNKGGPETLINLQDMQGMMETCRGLPGPSLDIILHSPGGIAEAASSIVRYLRQKYSDITVYVPLAAMSAATMWALSANRIVMGNHSQLGPIDPQVSIGGAGAMPARTILDQFERAKTELAKNPATLPAWAPVISQYGPGLLEACEKAEELARGLVQDWLREYMFAGEPDAPEKAERIAKFFADYTLHKSHSIGIFRDQAAAQGVVIESLEDKQELQDAVLSVHHATMLTLNATPCIKLIENNLDRGFFVQAAQVLMPQMPFQFPQQLQQPQPPPPQAPQAQPKQ